MYLDNACFNVTCQNGGTCVASGTSYHCACVAGYYGTLCQTSDYKR